MQRVRLRVLRSTAAFLIAAFSFSACGGGGASMSFKPPTSSSTGAYNAGLTAGSTRAGSVVLPAGTGISPVTLSAANGFGTTPVSATGTFTVPTIDTDTQYAEINSAAGNTLLAGWLGSQEPVINAHTTAEVYVYYATYTYTIPDPAARAEVITSIQTLPGLAAVETAIAAALVAHPTLATGSDPNVQKALATLVAAVRTSTAMAVKPGAGLQSMQKILNSQKTQDFSFSPGTGGSGITIIDNGQNSISFQNTLRREAAAFVDDVSHIDAVSGNVINDNAKDTNPPVTIPATSAIGSFGGSISAYLQGNYVGIPVTTSPIELPNVDGAKSTTYRVAIVSPGNMEGDYSRLTGVEQEKFNEVFIGTLIYSVTLPLIASLLVPNAKFSTGGLDQASINALLKDTIGLIAASAEVKSALETGTSTDVLNALSKAFAGTVSLLEPVVELAAHLFASASANLAPGFAKELAESFIEPLALVDAGIAVVDSLGIIRDTSGVNKADIYTIVAMDPTVTLLPASNSVAPNGVLTLTAGVHPPESDPVVYVYTNTALFGHLTDNTGSGHLDNFTSSSATVTYTANGTGGGTDTVRVMPQVLIGGLPANKKNLTVSSATVAVGSVPSPTPQQITASVTLSPGGSCQQFGYNGYTQVFTATISSNAPANTPFYYAWAETGFQLTVPPPLVKTGAENVASLQNYATLTIPPLSSTSGLSGIGGGLSVELYLADFYGKLYPVNNLSGQPGATAVVKIDAGSVTCPASSSALSTSRSLPGPTFLWAPPASH
jgi:hypothetical protein